ncbi:MAG TPA: sulfocyanin-like copper-binding protein, partial [Gemmatimonadaceae bacterium]|nr:sulfocyanin-like copper-binding protein [Gemmatimonadaceae bacterium]
MRLPLPRTLPRHALVALLGGALSLVGCEHVSQEEAARADSSAAGYQVGSSPGPVVDTAAIASARAERLAAAAARRDSIAAAARRDSITRAERTRADARRDSTRTAEARRDSIRRSAARRDSIHRESVRRDSVRVAHIPKGPVRVNDFLTYDASTKTISVQLVAGYTGTNGSLNFNGGARGTQGISVPLGWHVHVSLTNRSQDLQHSAVVVREVLPPPLELPAAAFDGATIEKRDDGIRNDEAASFDFVPTRRGRFMLACGVAGHAEGGMWIRLTVIG